MSEIFLPRGIYQRPSIDLFILKRTVGFSEKRAGSVRREKNTSPKDGDFYYSFFVSTPCEFAGGNRFDHPYACARVYVRLYRL